NGWDQDVSAALTWRLSPRTRLSLSESFIDNRDLTSEIPAEGVPDVSVDTGAQFGQRSIRQNAFGVELLHELGRRHHLQLAADRSDTRFDRTGFTKTEVTSLSGSYVYELLPTDNVRPALSATRQTVVPDVGRETDSDFYNVSLRWFHYFSRTFSL